MTHERLADHSVPNTSTPILGSPNRFKLAVFSANMAGGANLTTAPEAPQVTWAESVRIAQAADHAGIEGLIPVARWRGMAEPQRREGHRSFDTFTWAAGLAAVTERIQVFATFHVPVTHPVAAAKQIATVDHISGGRFALNIVAGWNSDEFQMFGLEQKEHDDRYSVADEWLTLLRRIVESDEEFDFFGEHFTSRGVLSEPKPVQTPMPVIMNAGYSPAGRDFAARNADVSFALLPSMTGMAGPIAGMKDLADESYGRRLSVFGAGHIVCAPTEREAHDAYDRMVHEFGDWVAADNALRLLIPNSQSAQFDRKGMGAAAIAGFFALPVIGTPDQIVEQLVEMADAGMDGLAMSWLDYEDGLRTYDEQLRPLLVRAGLRAA